MGGYSKLFASIIHSTVWREPDHIRLVWITMLAMKDMDGIVEASVPGLADAARVGIPQCEEALSRLASPDQYSRTPDNEGRRILEIPGGWKILNHEIYQDKCSQEERNRKNAEKQKRYRERLKSRNAGNTGNALRNTGNSGNMLHTTATDTATDTDKDTSKEMLPTPSETSLYNKKSRAGAGPLPSSPLEALSLAKKFLEIFNEVFERNCHARSMVERKIAGRLEKGTPAWQILCAPILQLAMDPNTGKVRNFGPDMLLRDGTHRRRGENGATYGGTDWLERIYMNADRQRLDARLTAIAVHYGLTEHIQRTGATLTEQGEQDAR